MMLSLCTHRFLRILVVVSLVCNVFLLLTYTFSTNYLCVSPLSEREESTNRHVRLQQNNSVPVQSRQVIFVGGVPRSGTTLLRAMLDAHPDVHCGEETRVIPRILSMRNRWDKSNKEHQRLVEAGMDQEVLDRATRAFISEIIMGHGLPSKYLCNKDPLALNYMQDVVRLYPKAKFVLMIRDGRSVAYSIVSRNVTITGVNSKSYMSAAMFWNKVVTRMTRDCSMLGKHRCLEVRYEKLVKSPRAWMQGILGFLNVPWNENVLHHEQFINSEVLLSRMELSSSQVEKAVNTGALEKWRKEMPLEIQKQIYKECDMMKELGYPPV